MTTLDFEPLTVVVPLREEPPGVIRVGKSRVLLELVLRRFKDGATPEDIVQSFDTLNLADVYTVIGRYLAAPAPFEEYLRVRDEAAARTRRMIEEVQGPQVNLRAILLARKKAMEEGDVLKLVSDENFDGKILRGFVWPTSTIWTWCGFRTSA